MRDQTRTWVVGVVAACFACSAFIGCSRDQGVSMEVRIAQSAPADSLTRMDMTVWGGNLTYYVHNRVLLTQRDVSMARAITKDGVPAMQVILTDAAQRKLAHATRHNVGARLGIIINGQLQCAPEIHGPIDTGILIVTGHMMSLDADQCSRELTREVNDHSGVNMSNTRDVAINT